MYKGLLQSLKQLEKSLLAEPGGPVIYPVCHRYCNHCGCFRCHHRIFLDRQASSSQNQSSLGFCFCLSNQTLSTEGGHLRIQCPAGPLGGARYCFQQQVIQGRELKFQVKKSSDRKVQAIIGFHMAKEGYQSARS